MSRPLDIEIGHLLEERRSRQGDGLAYARGRTGHRVTWTALAEQVTTWAAGVDVAGVVVAMLVEDPLAFITTYLGLLAAGAVVLPLEAGGGRHPTGQALAGFAASAVVCDMQSGLQAASLAGIPTWPIDADRYLPRITGGQDLGPGQGASRVAPVTWAEPATVVLRTSGTTGTPKGVPLTLPRLLHGARSVVGHHGLTPADRIYSCLPLFHVNAQVVGVLSALMSGAGLVVDERFHRAGFWQVLERFDVTILNAVPAILAILAAEEPPPATVASRVRFARSASSPLPAATRERFEARCGIGVLETYGMTEAAGQVCANPLEAADRRPGSVGRPVGVHLRVVDATGATCPPDVAGEVQLRGPGVVPSYLLIPESGGGHVATVAATDADGWLATGDHGVLDQGGMLSLVGRGDGVINRGGEKIYPRELEEVLRRHPGVADAVVVGEPDPVLGERPVAFVVPLPTGMAVGEPAALLEALGALCAQELSRARQPARIELRDHLPVTPTGKVRRDLLRADLALRAAPAPPAPPVTVVG